MGNATLALSKQMWGLWVTLVELSIRIHKCGISIAFASALGFLSLRLPYRLRIDNQISSGDNC